MATPTQQGTPTVDVDALQRILTRLVLTEDEKLQSVLDKLLPLVIAKLDNATPQVQQKILSILSHVNTRLAASPPSVTLPLAALAHLYATTTSPLVRNFALVYCERGCERATPQQRLEIVAPLMTALPSRSVTQRHMVLRQVVSGLEYLANQRNMPQSAEEIDEFIASKFSSFVTTTTTTSAMQIDGDGNAEEGLRLFLEFALRYMMYATSSTTRAASVPRQSTTSSIMNGDERVQQQAPFGLSRNDLTAIEGKAPPSPDHLQARKLGILNFTALASLNPTSVLALYLAAASDPVEAVARRGDELLKKRCAVDAAKPIVDIESQDVVEPLFVLFHGGSTSETVVGTEEEEQQRGDDVRSPASPSLRSRLLYLFCKSVAAANASPWAIMTITTCLFPPQSTDKNTNTHAQQQQRTTTIPPRIQQQGMEFAVWVFKHASPETLLPAAPAVVDHCLSLLDLGTATTSTADKTTTTSIHLRSFAYQAIGQLAQRLPQVFKGRMDLVERFFNALASEPPGVRAAVSEATSCLATAFGRQGREGVSEEDERAIFGILENAVHHHQEAVRGAAVQWAVQLFPFDNVQARYVCILEASDARPQLADAAVEGLDAVKMKARKNATNSSSSLPSLPGSTPLNYPNPRAMLEYLCSRHPSLRSPVEEGRRIALPPKSFTAAISFLQSSLSHLLSSGNTNKNDDNFTSFASKYFIFVENALVREAPSDLHAKALAAILSTAAVCPPAFVTAYATRPSLFERLLGHVDPGTRDTAGRLLGTLVSPPLRREGEGGEGDGGEMAHRRRRLMESMISKIRSFSSSSLGSSSSGSEQQQPQKQQQSGGGKVRYEEADGATAALGYLTAAALFHATDSTTSIALIESAFETLHTQLTLPDKVVDPQLKATAACAIGTALLPLSSLSLSPPSTPLLPEDKLSTYITSIIALVSSATKDPKVLKKAIQALGFCAYGINTTLVSTTIIPALLEQRTTKVESVAFAVGEALCFAFGEVTGVGGAADLLHRPFVSLADFSSSSSSSSLGEAGSGTDMMEITTTTTTIDDDTERKQRQTLILHSILDECMPHPRPEVRCSGSIWLVSLLLFNSRATSIHVILPQAQESFTVLFGDESELTQEMASRGVAAAYELADESTRQALVDNLVGTLSGGSSAGGGGTKAAASTVAAAGRKRTLTGDTRVFEPGSIGTVPGGGSLSTYKEICALANDLGQPDLVYRFMQLANHQAAMNASRGAAFGFASVAKIAGDALTPYIETLIPRLYRSLYDPQPKIRDSMKHIWVALIDDPRSALTTHFLVIMKYLISEMTGNQWRSREAAALAAADLLQGRQWGEVEAVFEQLWTAAFRVMDDVKESVRQAGLALVRCVRGLTLRLADREFSSSTGSGSGSGSTTTTTTSEAAVAIALPLLIRLGLPSRVPEVQALAVDTVAKIVKVASADVVRPHLSAVVPPLLESLSGLEDVRLNYVEQHAERFGVDAGKLESVRVAASQGGVLGETLDSCARSLDGPAFTALAPALAGLIRRGVGVNTRTGCGRFVTQVTRRLRGDVAPAVPTLTRAFQEAAMLERSPAVRKSYASANAVLSKYAATARVDKHVAQWLERMSDVDDTSASSDASARLVSGLFILALARESGDTTFTRYANDVAPVAFMAQFDDDAGVAAVWTEIWEESTTSVGAGLRLHAKSVVERVVQGLKSGQWGRKKAAAIAAQRLCAKGSADALGVDNTCVLLDALLAELPGRLWDGKESVLSGVGAVGGALMALRSGDDDGTAAAAREKLAQKEHAVVAALLEAASKKKSVYRKEALVQLQKVLEACKGKIEFLPTVSPLLCRLAEEAVQAPRTDSGTGGGGDAQGMKQSKGLKEQEAEENKNGGGSGGGSGGIPIAEVMACLGTAWKYAALPSVAAGDAEATAWPVLGADVVASVLSIVSRITDQTVVLQAGIDLFHNYNARLHSTGNAPLPLAAAPTSLVGQQAVRLAGEGRSAALREQGVQLLGEVMRASVDADEYGSAIQELMERERVPSVKAALLELLHPPKGNIM